MNDCAVHPSVTPDPWQGTPPPHSRVNGGGRSASWGGVEEARLWGQGGGSAVRRGGLHGALGRGARRRVPAWRTRRRVECKVHWGRLDDAAHGGPSMWDAVRIGPARGQERVLRDMGRSLRTEGAVPAHRGGGPCAPRGRSLRTEGAVSAHRGGGPCARRGRSLRTEGRSLRTEV